MRDHLTFFRNWCAAPFRTAAMAPSGRTLSRLITLELGPDTGPVLELGPGTGVFTRAMLERGVPEDQIALVELNPEFADTLAQKFPRAQVFCMNAADLAGQSYFEDGVSTVISGLGLLSMRREVVEAILRGVLVHLQPNGTLRQFTYGPRCPVPQSVLNALGLRAERTGRTLRNLPPATVYAVARDSAIDAHLAGESPTTSNLRDHHA